MARSPVHDLVPVWLAIGLVFAILAGTAAGILAWRSGKNVAASVLTGGGAFVAAVTLVVLVLSLLCGVGPV